MRAVEFGCITLRAGSSGKYTAGVRARSLTIVSQSRHALEREELRAPGLALLRRHLAAAHENVIAATMIAVSFVMNGQRALQPDLIHGLRRALSRAYGCARRKRSAAIGEHLAHPVAARELSPLVPPHSTCALLGNRAFWAAHMMVLILEEVLGYVGEEVVDHEHRETFEEILESPPLHHGHRTEQQSLPHAIRIGAVAERRRHILRAASSRVRSRAVRRCVKQGHTDEGPGRDSIERAPAAPPALRAAKRAQAGLRTSVASACTYF